MLVPLLQNKRMGTNSQKRKQRTISLELFNQWRNCTRLGDGKLLVDLLQVSKPTIDNALTYGHANKQSLIDGINQFFANRLIAERETAANLKNLQQEVENTKRTSAVQA